MSTHLPLSASRIKNAIATGQGLWLSDDNGARGAGRLVLRVTPAGAARFYFRWPRTKNNPERTVPLGTYSRTKQPNRLTLEEARHQAAMLSAYSILQPLAPEDLVRLARGGSREATAGEKLGASVPAPTMAPRGLCRAALPPGPRQCPTLAQVCRDYVQFLRSSGKVSAGDVEAEFKRFIYVAEIGQLTAADVTSGEFLVLLRSLKDAPRTQQKFRSYLHAAYAKAISAELDMTADAPELKYGISSNPIAPIEFSGQKTKVRTRALSIPELRALWVRMQLTRENSGSLPLRAARLALLLGGQRCEQLIRVPREDLDIEAGTILLMDPKGRRATPRPHLLPLPPAAAVELNWLNNHSANVGSPFVFSGAPASKHMGSSQVSILVTALCREMLAARVCVAQFQFSDFRRTVETQLAGLGVPSDTRKRLQSHDLGGVQAKHYDMYEYLEEKRKALVLWERFLTSLMDGTRPPRWGEDLTRRGMTKSP